MNKYWPPLLAVAFALGIACAVPTAAKDVTMKTVGAYRIESGTSTFGAFYTADEVAAKHVTMGMSIQGVPRQSSRTRARIPTIIS